MDIVIAYIFDFLIFKHSFSAMSLFGGGLVLLATIGSGLVSLLQETDYKNVESEATLAASS